MPRPTVNSSATQAGLSREESLARMAREEFDLCVVGGGINGAAVARDAAMRGLNVALVEARDFAGATSSRSSKLIHGGFRYLPRGHFVLVYQALRERERLRRLTAPHLVHPIRFLLPAWRGRGFGRFTIMAGLSLYDLFARPPRDERHVNLDAGQVLELEPRLNPAALTGGALYYDAWGDDARITLENVLDAALHGTAIANYAAVEGVSRAGGKISAAQVRDVLGGNRFEIHARVFVNAAGPWADEVRRMDDPGARPCVRLTKGVHLVFPLSSLPVRTSLVLAGDRGRIVFVMPHGRYVLVGTTDTDFSGDPASVATEAPDAAYLLDILAENLPAVRLGPEDIAASFAGLRALVRSSRTTDPAAVRREEIVAEGASGMLTVAGGKLTTHRETAERLVARVMKKLGRAPGACPTVNTPLPGARPLPGSDARAGGSIFDPEMEAALGSRYGTRREMVARIARERPELAAPLCPACPAVGAEVVHAIRNEMAQSVADFLVRRTSLTWLSPPEAEAAAPAVARIMARELGWPPEREREEASGFVASLKRDRAA